MFVFVRLIENVKRFEKVPHSSRVVVLFSRLGQKWELLKTIFFLYENFVIDKYLCYAISYKRIKTNLNLRWEYV